MKNWQSPKNIELSTTTDGVVDWEEAYTRLKEEALRIEGERNALFEVVKLLLGDTDG